MNHQMTMPLSAYSSVNQVTKEFKHSFLQVNDMTPNVRDFSFDSVNQDFGFVWKIFGMVGQNMKVALDEFKPTK